MFTQVTVHSRKGCPIAPHYRLPLYALNKKFGMYRKVVEHLQTLTSVEAATSRNTYLSVMQYLNDICHIGLLFVLDNTCDGFHDECRESLATAHGITFEGLKNGECADFWFFDHDFCGAIQGSGAGEDLKSLLNAVDASINQTSTKSPANSMAACNDVDMDSDTFPKFPLPFDINARSLALRTLGRDAREIIIGCIGRWLPSHMAMRFREIQGLDHNDPLDNLVSNGLLVTARSTDEYLEIFGMVEMMATCQEIFKDRASVSQFFTAAGRILYTLRKGRTCVVQYGQTLGSMDELDVNMHVDSNTAVSVGVQNDSAGVQYDSVGVQCDFIVEAIVQCRSMFDHEDCDGFVPSLTTYSDDSGYIPHNAKVARQQVKLPQYTIEDLVNESQTGGHNVTPCISSFLTDPDGMEFVRSTIGSDHDSWLHIARHIASLILHECLPGSMSRMAAFIMSLSVEIWIKDISIECKNALQNETGDTVLPPL
ncbi:hypothetical protein BD769DRAFT_1390943, partial [Suillus cothurnatus]